MCIDTQIVYKLIFSYKSFMDIYAGTFQVQLMNCVQKICTLFKLMQ